MFELLVFFLNKFSLLIIIFLPLQNTLKNPVVNVGCWHVQCQKCWLISLVSITIGILYIVIVWQAECDVGRVINNLSFVYFNSSRGIVVIALNQSRKFMSFVLVFNFFLNMPLTLFLFEYKWWISKELLDMDTIFFDFIRWTFL